MNQESHLVADSHFGFIDSGVSSRQSYNPILVDNVGSNTMLKAILAELRRSASFTFSVAFVSSAAVSLLKQALIDFEGDGTIVTSTYLEFNSPSVFRELMALENVDIRIVPDGDVGFHAKGYVFQQEATYSAIIGSSNLTANALIRNHEWNLRFCAMPDGDVVSQIAAAIDDQLERSVELTTEWIDQYETCWTEPPQRQEQRPGQVLVANPMQIDALREIERYRSNGATRAVVVSATGTGKTILAALDVRAVNPSRMLFVVHREQIIDRAIQEFSRVLGVSASEFGKFVGGRKEIDRRYVFASVQSLSKPETLASVDPNHFDYVLIDEVHRAGAISYRRILDHFDPSFTLGVTATPERTDDFNVFELFDFNVPYEIRLNSALDNDMLAPFHYFGVADYEADGRVIDDATNLSRLVMPERADHLVRALAKYGHRGVPVRGLMFCSRNDEASALVELLNKRQVDGRNLRTKALSGDSTITERESSVAALERGDLDYLVTVDIFNEGIDIPSVNQVVMLRQTQSSIVFTQQLGRGLRKSNGKSHLVVIDFIGNYSNNYLIPIALFGDSSLNRDGLKRRVLEAGDVGSVQGVSAVNFDRISRERVLESISVTKLDKKPELKRAVIALQDRLGNSLYYLTSPDLILSTQSSWVGKKETFGKRWYGLGFGTLCQMMLSPVC